MPHLRVVLDTNVLVSAMLSGGGASRQVLRLCLERAITPLGGAALFAEYEDVLAREPLVERSRLGKAERDALFDALMAVSAWTPIYSLWRPNLPDAADDHLVELALAGGASWIVTANVRHLAGGELRIDPIRVGAPETFLGAWELER
jgi:putative PIN family toxin of toxin-antitoxin system